MAYLGCRAFLTGDLRSFGSFEDFNQLSKTASNTSHCKNLPYQDVDNCNNVYFYL